LITVGGVGNDDSDGEIVGVAESVEWIECVGVTVGVTGAGGEAVGFSVVGGCSGALVKLF